MSWQTDQPTMYLSQVWLGSRWYLNAREYPYALHRFSETFRNVPFKTLPMFARLTTLLVLDLSVYILKRCLFVSMPLPQAIESWMPWSMCVFYEGNTSSSSSSQSFRDPSHLRRLPIVRQNTSGDKCSARYLFFFLLTTFLGSWSVSAPFQRQIGIKQV